MFGCLTRSAYFASRRKRSRISQLPARSSGRTFNAARRPDPFCSDASQTMPIPPSPSWDSRRKPPTTSPMLNVAATGHSYHRREQEIEIERPERLHDVRIEMLSRLPSDLCCGLFGVPGVGVWPRMSQRVEVVGHDHDSPAHRDLVLEPALRITRSVPAFVMRNRDLLGQLQDRPARPRKDLGADQRV